MRACLCRILILRRPRNSRLPNGCWDADDDGLALSHCGSSRGGSGSNWCGRESRAASWSRLQSPARMMLDGEMPLSRRFLTAVVAWRSWVDKGYSGARAIAKRSVGSPSIPCLLGERTVVERGNSDGTLAMLLKGREHLKMVLPGRKSKSTTLRSHFPPRSDQLNLIWRGESIVCTPWKYRMQLSLCGPVWLMGQFCTLGKAHP